jgi:hypothetical protein
VVSAQDAGPLRAVTKSAQAAGPLRDEKIRAAPDLLLGLYRLALFCFAMLCPPSFLGRGDTLARGFAEDPFLACRGCGSGGGSRGGTGGANSKLTANMVNFCLNFIAFMLKMA